MFVFIPFFDNHLYAQYSDWGIRPRDFLTYVQFIICTSIELIRMISVLYVILRH